MLNIKGEKQNYYIGFLIKSCKWFFQQKMIFLIIFQGFLIFLMMIRNCKKSTNLVQNLSEDRRKTMCKKIVQNSIPLQNFVDLIEGTTIF